MPNEYQETVSALAPQIAEAKARLTAGDRPSDIANLLHSQGTGEIHLLIVFREATGVSLGTLKSFCRWWRNGAVSNEADFNSFAAEVYRPEASAPAPDVIAPDS